jgi:hypothetical protein
VDLLQERAGFRIYFLVLVDRGFTLDDDLMQGLKELIDAMGVPDSDLQQPPLFPRPR